MSAQGIVQMAKEYRDVIQMFLTLAGILVLIANLYIASLIAPIKGDINRVEAVAVQNAQILQNRREDIESIDVILNHIQDIDRRLDRIEDLLVK